MTPGLDLSTTEWAVGAVQALWLTLAGWLHVRQGRLEAALAVQKTEQQQAAVEGDERLWSELRELRRVVDQRHETMGRDLREMVTKQDLRDFEARLQRLLVRRVTDE